MKAVLISTQPKWVAKTTSGEKTIEVRKTRPKIETPFKCCIYATNSGDRIVLKNDIVFEISKSLTGKVIGEFVCDRIETFDVPYPAWSKEYLKPILSGACLTYSDLHSYIGSGNRGYAWHISNLVVYDKPKELSEFWTIKCTNKRNGCQGCEVKPNCIKTITRPPQSWQYVEV